MFFFHGSDAQEVFVLELIQYTETIDKIPLRLLIDESFPWKQHICCIFSASSESPDVAAFIVTRADFQQLIRNATSKS